MSSRMLRAKKFMASKLSDSAAGRKVVMKFLGPAGDRMLTALDSAIVKHSGRSVAKSTRVDIFKLATKVGVLVQNHNLTEQQMEPAREPGLTMVNTLIETLEAPVESRNHVTLGAAIMSTHDVMLEIIRPHMKEANAQKLTHVMSFLASAAFLEPFLREDIYSGERDEILKNMKRLSRPTETEVSATSDFQKERLQQKRNLLANLLANPSFEDYLRYEDTGKAVREWLVQQSPEYINHVNFMYGVVDFKQINSRTLLHARAQMLYDKHFSSSAAAPIAISEDQVAAIQRHFDEDAIRKDMFDAALHGIVEALTSIFNAGFRDSEQFMDLQHELEMTDFKLQAQFRILAEGAEEIDLEHLDDDALDAEDDDGEEETKG